MPVNPDAAGDLLDLYLCLARSRGAAMPRNDLRQRFGNGVDRLVEIGAAYPGRPLRVLKCPACYEDHPVEVEYDAASRRSWIFCPEAGRVWVEAAELATLHLHATWLPDHLVRALDIAPRPPRLTLIEDAAWLLGDTVVGSTKVSVALAVGINTTPKIQALIAGAARRKPLGIDVLLVAGCRLPDYVDTVIEHSAIALDEVAFIEKGTVCINRSRLGAWIRGIAKGLKRFQNPSG